MSFNKQMFMAMLMVSGLTFASEEVATSVSKFETVKQYATAAKTSISANATAVKTAVVNVVAKNPKTAGLVVAVAPIAAVAGGVAYLDITGKEEAAKLAAAEVKKGYYAKTSDYVAAQYNTAKDYVVAGYDKAVASVKNGYIVTKDATVNGYSKSVEAVKAHPYITAGTVTAVVVAGAAYAYSQYANNDEQN